MIADIDKKHVEYTNASIDRIRYQMNADRSAKGKLAAILQHSNEEQIFKNMSRSLEAYRHSYVDMQSLYNRTRRTVKTEGKPLALEKKEESGSLVESFLKGVRRQYSNRKIDAYIEDLFGEKEEFTTKEVTMEQPEYFILFLLGTLRGCEKGASYRVEFEDGNVDRQGYRLPLVRFLRKKGREK